MPKIKNSTIFIGFTIIVLVCVFIIFRNRNNSFESNSLVILPGYELPQKIGDLVIEANGNGTINIFDATTHKQLMVIVEKVENYKNFSEYRSKRIDSDSILLDCEAAKPGNIQHCDSVKLVTSLRDNDFFAARYRLQGTNLSDDEESHVSYDILDVLLPNGTLLSGTVGVDMSDERLRILADAIRKSP